MTWDPLDIQTKAIKRMAKASDNGVGVRLSAEETAALAMNYLANVIADMDFETLPEGE